MEEAPWPLRPLRTQPTRGSSARLPPPQPPGTVEGGEAPSRARARRFPRARSRRRARDGGGGGGLATPAARRLGPTAQAPRTSLAGNLFHAELGSPHCDLGWHCSHVCLGAERGCGSPGRFSSPPTASRRTRAAILHTVRSSATSGSPIKERSRLIYTKARVRQDDLGILGSKSYLIFAESHHAVLSLQQVLHLARHLGTAHRT